MPGGRNAGPAPGAGRSAAIPRPATLRRRPAGQPGTAQGNGARSGSTQPARAAGLASVAGW